MKNIKTMFKIHLSTYVLILSFLFTGLIKNIILIYIIVLFHELGHILIIKLLKYKIIRVDIYPSGGLTLIDKKINTCLAHDFLIASFGIIFQIILAGIFYYLYFLSIIRFNTYDLFCKYNIAILIFNLLPLIPLDGYQIFRCFGEYFFPYKKAFYISLIISIVFIFSILTFDYFFTLNNYLIISFLIYKLINEFKNFKYQNYRFQLERYLNDFPYRQISHENKADLNLLKKDTYHFFRNNDTYLSEKKLLQKKYSSLL